MKKLILIVLAVVLIIGTALSCTQETPAPTTPQTTTQTPSSTPSVTEGQRIVIEPIVPAAPSTPKPTVAPDKVYKLRFNDWGPPQIDLGLRESEWAQLVEERSGGRIECDVYFSESLLKRPDTYRGLEAGLADVSIYVLGSCTGIHQINRVIDLPGTGIPSQKSEADILDRLWAKYPEMVKEMGNVEVLHSRGLPGTHIFMTDKFHQILVPADAAGVKTYANQQWTDVFNDIGIAIVNPAVMEWYSSLERNLIQGMFIHWLVPISFGLNELFKYDTICGGGLGMQHLMYLMNKDTFNELPPDLQQVVLDTSETTMMAYLQDDPKTINASIEQAKMNGATIVELTDDQLQLWLDLAKPIHEEWIADSEAAGFTNARAIYNDMMAMIPEYE